MRRVRHAGVGKAGCAQTTGIAMAAGTSVGVGAVARHGEAEVHAQANALTHDVGLAEELQRRMHAQARAFHAGLGGQIRQHLEGTHELWPAVRVAGIVDRIDAAEQVVGADHFGPTQASDNMMVLRAGT